MSNPSARRANSSADAPTDGCSMADPVIVDWLDAWEKDEDADPLTWPRLYPVRTTGWLIRDEDEVVSVAAEVLPRGDGYRAVTHIPRAVVLRIQHLKPKKGE